MKSRLPEIERKLGPAVTKALKESAGKIARQASANAPVRHGDLKESLADPENVRPVATTLRGKPVVGFGVYAQWYWFLVEFGHEATKEPGPKGGVTGKAAAHPFLIPAAEVERPKLLADVKKALGDL